MPSTSSRAGSSASMTARPVRADSSGDYYATPTPTGKTRSSPTGRVPQWVVDEAAGRPTPPVPFRGPTSIPPGPSSIFGTQARNITIFLAVVAVSAGAYFLRAPSPSARGLLAGREAVAAPARQAPPPSREEASAPLGAAPRAPAASEGTGFRFMRHQDRSAAPITWSPCRPIHYVIRPDNAHTRRRRNTRHRHHGSQPSHRTAFHERQVRRPKAPPKTASPTSQPDTVTAGPQS